MLTADRPAMATTIQELVERTGIEGLMLLNDHGAVRFAADPGAVGRVLRTTNAGCVDLSRRGRGRGPSADGRGAAVRRPAGCAQLPAYRRIDVTCHACHDPDQAYNGVLLTT